MIRSIAIVLVAACVACAPGELTGAAADRLCKVQGLAQARDLAADARLVGVFEASFADVVSWREQRSRTIGRHPDLTWTDLRPLDPIAVCFFDGTFHGLTRTPPSGVPVARERIAVIVRRDGKGALGTYGQRQDTPIAGPRSGP